MLKAMFLLLLLLQHGSTYGGNPLGCKVAITALKVRHLLNGVIFSSFIFMFNSDKFMLGLMGARLHFLVKGHSLRKLQLVWQSFPSITHEEGRGKS